jgi:hypothetical protein
VSAPAPEQPKRPDRGTILALTFLAEVAGTIVIVLFAPFDWTTRLIVVAVYLGVVHYTSLAILRSRGG